MVIAVRQALDYDNTWRASLVVFIGWAVQVIFVVLAISIFGGFEGIEPTR